MCLKLASLLGYRKVVDGEAPPELTTEEQPIGTVGYTGDPLPLGEAGLWAEFMKKRHGRRLV